MEFCVFFMVIGESVRVILSELLKKKGLTKMETVYFFWTEYIKFDYTDMFLAQIEFESTEERGLHCQIFLVEKNGDSKYKIGGISSPEYDMDMMHQFAQNLISRKDYLLSMWRKHHRKNK